MDESTQLSSSSNMNAGVFVVLLSTLHVILVQYVYERVPEPYMDEIFHVNQTRRYCQGDYSWNEKITTPPALYVLAMSAFCGRERFVNSLLLPFALLGARHFRSRFTTALTTSTAILVVFLPTLFQSSLLFYTDLLSFTTILWALSLDNPIVSTILFAIACLTRQTNIVWAACYGVYHLVERIDKHSIISSILRSACRLLPLIGLGIAFVAAFVLNGYSVVLGDRSAHVPVAHFMQIHYFALFVCFTAAPYLLLSGRIVAACVGLLRHPFRTLIVGIAIALCVRIFTMEHAYLLADNRHFTFYIWRKWFRRHWTLKYALVPAYLIALKALGDSIAHVPRLLRLLYVMATMAVLVPAHLLETRYFIVPYAVWRLSVREHRWWVVMLEVLYQLGINILVMHIFLNKPFQWANEPGVEQRFMW